MIFRATVIREAEPKTCRHGTILNFHTKKSSKMLLECCSKENVECGTEKAASFLAEVVSLLGNFELNNYFPGFQIYIKLVILSTS